MGKKKIGGRERRVGGGGKKERDRWARKREGVERGEWGGARKREIDGQEKERG